MAFKIHTDDLFISDAPIYNAGEIDSILVDTSNITDMNILVYDETSDRWVVRPIPESGTSTFEDGTALEPSITFTDDLDTGLYRETDNELSISSGGTKTALFNPQGFNSLLQIRGIDGSSSAPTYSFTNDIDTGIFRISDNEIGLTTGGQQRLSISSSGAVFNNIDAITFNSSSFNAGSLMRVTSPSGFPGMIFNVETNSGSNFRYDFLASENTGEFVIQYVIPTVSNHDFLKFNPLTSITSLGGNILEVNPFYIQFNSQLRVNSLFRYTSNTSSSGPAAISTARSYHRITTTGTADALTLANGQIGQSISILYVEEAAGADTAILTPASAVGFTTITFNNLGDSVQLLYDTTGWFIISSFGAMIS